MAALFCVCLAGIGVVRNIQWRESLSKSWSSFLTGLSGIFAYIVIIGICQSVYGESIQTGAVITGLIGTVVLNIGPIKEGLDNQAFYKYDKTQSFRDKFGMGAIAVWARYTVAGIGKITSILFYVTIIGIPFYKWIENAMPEMDVMVEQHELRERKQQLEELERRNNARRAVREGREQNNG